MTSLFANNRLIVTGLLDVITPLLVGSGEGKDEVSLEHDGEKSEASQIITDSDGKPYIPGSSLKGALRALAVGKPESAKLFGEPHGDSGNMGLLTVYGASFKEAPKLSHVPYYDQKSATGIDARTAIDGATGTAAANKLFHERRVSPEAKFNFHCELILLNNTNVEDLLGRLLGSLMDGFALGRGKGAGQGRVKLSGVVILEVKGITETGDWGPVTAKHEVKVDPNHRLGDLPKPIKLKLTCNGPYLVNDPSWEKDYYTESKEKRKTLPTMKALGMKEGVTAQAILPGTSLKGVLRSRCAWLEACAGGNEEKLTKELFGSTDAAGLLRIEEIRCQHQGQARLSSVKLDRFSGAPIERALFSTQCFVNPVFNVDLKFSDRESEADRTQLCDLLRRLWDDLKENGIILGHGGNHGFGWCRAEII